MNKLDNYDYMMSGDFPEIDEIIKSDDFFTKINLGPSFFKGKIVLEIACGTGRHTRRIASYGVKEIIGIDKSKESIERAKREINSPNVKLYCMDFYDVDIDKWKGRFDYILISGCLMHMKSPYKTIWMASRLLKDNGNVSFWVYERQNFMKEAILKIMRNATLRMDYEEVMKISKLLKAINCKASRILLPSSWRLVDTFDNLTVKYCWKFTESKLREMMLRAGFKPDNEVRKYSVNTGIRKMIHGKYGGGFGLFGTMKSAAT